MHIFDSVRVIDEEETSSRKSADGRVALDTRSDRRTALTGDLVLALQGLCCAVAPVSRLFPSFSRGSAGATGTESGVSGELRYQETPEDDSNHVTRWQNRVGFFVPDLINLWIFPNRNMDIYSIISSFLNLVCPVEAIPAIE